MLIVLENYNRNNLWPLSNIYQTVIERLSNHCQKHLSNHCQTSIELSNVYRNTFNPNYTHWVPRNLNLNLLNRELFFSLNRQSSNDLIVHWRPKCGNSSHKQIINHVFVYLSCNAAFLILFKAWTIYSYSIIKFLSQILWKKHS